MGEMTGEKEKMRKLKAIALGMLIAAAAAVWGPGEVLAGIGTSITVKDESWVKGKEICLKDIARIDAEGHLKDLLGSVVVCLAPEPGRARVVEGAWIESRIRSKRWLPPDIPISVPEFVRIGRKSQSLEEGLLLGLFKGYIAGQPDVGDDDFKVSRFKVVGNGPLPEGEIKVELVRRAETDLTGNVSVAAVVRVDGEIERRPVISGWVDRFAPVVCTNGPLKQNTVIAEDDISIQRRNVSRLPQGVLARTEDVVGKRIKQSLNADAVISARMVEDPPLVRRGDRVTIIAESPTLLVTAVGIAETKGCMGDQVRVKNLVDRKEIVGRVVDESTVRVEF